MNTRGEPCPRCRWTGRESCEACDPKGYWPEGSSHRYLESVTLTGNLRIEKNELQLSDEIHGIIVGIINRDKMPPDNYLVLIEGDDSKAHLTLPADKITKRKPETLPRCPLCNELLEAKVGQTVSFLNSIVWGCANFGCDAHSIAYEFPYGFDFSVFDQKPIREGADFPDWTLKQLWSAVFRYELELAERDYASREDFDAAWMAPRHQEMVRLLTEAGLIQTLAQ